MNIKTNFLIGTLMLASAALPLRGVAQENERILYKSVTVSASDGKVYSVDLVNRMEGHINADADLEIHYPHLDEDGSTTIDPETGAPIYETVLIVPAYQIDSIVLNAANSGAETVSGLEFSLQYDVNTSILKISGAEGKEIAVVSADGRAEYAAKGESVTAIDMGRFGAGVHIVKIGTKSFKLLVK